MKSILLPMESIMASVDVLLVLSVCFLVALTCRCYMARGRKRERRKGFVSIHSGYRQWLKQQTLHVADDYFQLDAVIVSGHIGRNVGRLTLENAGEQRTVYLKREDHTPWLTRMRHFLVGHGWVSRSAREANMLASLEREGLAAPQWLATGEDDQGRSFVLVEEVTGAVPLIQYLTEHHNPEQRRTLAYQLGHLLARLHNAGFIHRDLYAKHVLIRAHNQEIVLLDWQRAWRGSWIAQSTRSRDIAALYATLPTGLLTPKDCIGFLHAYLQHRTGLGSSRYHLRSLLVEIDSIAARLRTHRHVREKRQAPTSSPQAWIHLDGESLSVTPTFAEIAEKDSLTWLHPQNHPPGLVPYYRRWLTLFGRYRVLLECRRQRLSLAKQLHHRLLKKPLIAPEQRRATLLWRLERHGVKAPRILAMGHRHLEEEKYESFLLTEPIPETIRFRRWWRQATDPYRLQLLRSLGQMLGRLHDACCYLDDEMNQIAVTTEGDLALETIEGITPLRRASTTRAAQNLRCIRTFLATQGCHDSGWSEVMAGYRETQSTSVSTLSSRRVGEHRPSSQMSRPMVDPPRSLWKRLTSAWHRLVERSDWKLYAGTDWVRQIMDRPVTDRFSSKQGRSTGRVKMPACDGSDRELVVYLKRHYQLPIWRGWLAKLFPGGNWSPAMQEYEHLEWARQQGVPVPQTAAAGEFVGRCGQFQSFLAVEELTDMLPVNEAIPQAEASLPPQHFQLWKRGVVAEMARLSRLLHDRRHFHKDLYLCHFYIHQKDIHELPGEPGDDPLRIWRNRIYLIDLHRLNHHPFTWWWWQLKDLAQLLYSSEIPGIDIRDQLRFWKHYREPGPQGWAERFLRWMVVLKWRRYRAHNQRIKQRRQTAVNK